MMSEGSIMSLKKLRSDMYIFFDLDDTLYERSVPFINTCRRLNIGGGSETLFKRAFYTCVKRADEVFLDSQRGIITMEEMYIYRYRMGFMDVGIELSDDEALEFQRVYSVMQKDIVLSEGIPELLDFCRERYSGIGIITNGPGQHQRDKLKILGLDRWVDPALTVISGDEGIDKPDPEIFLRAQKRCAGSADEIIMVGDVYEKDIEPALALGWRGVLLGDVDLSVRKSDFLRVAGGISDIKEALREFDDK